MLLPFQNTTEGASIVFRCKPDYQPQTEMQSICTRTGNYSWIPNPAEHNCTHVCACPQPPLNGSVKAKSSTYLEGETISFQCLPGLSPAKVMIATCTMEGAWAPNPRLLNCSTDNFDVNPSKDQGML